MIDDGPLYKLAMYRAVKRFDLDIHGWPYPPERGSRHDLYRDWTDYWRLRFERVLFDVALGTRKLIEAGKLSIEAQYEPILCLWAPLVGDRVPSSMSSHHFERYYDLDAQSERPMAILEFCHNVIHSFVLQPRFRVDGAAGLRVTDFFLASDRSRVTGVHLVPGRQSAPMYTIWFWTTWCMYI